MQLPDLQLNKCDAAAALTPEARRLHHAVLNAFIRTGRPPSRADLEHIAGGQGIDPAAALAELANRDVVALDRDGEIRAAYPFSPTPTPHRVTWDGGPTVSAMCAVDTLGISTMLDRPVTVTTAEPDTGRPITVYVDRDRATWHPDTAVVYAGATGEACCPSAERTCGFINFFTTADAAHGWATRHPGVTGVVLDQAQALACGIAEFGAFMQPSEQPAG